MATQEPRRRGRPTKLTPRAHHTIITAIRSGAITEHAARSAGIHPATIYRWAQAGRKPGTGREVCEFAADLADARAEISRKSVTRQPITDGEGREIGTRITRQLKNRTVEVTEEFTRPDRRALRARVRDSGRAAPGSLDALLGLGA